ncbi:hypothetical protein FE236_01280 [Mariprofundus erugo]|uniref:hypothetical protein n=1 Tax=Mariprofundus erugo TaxID=2528639 RepID=UPI0010FCF1D1|nr:hypothetical protein [Mariprofundus erugo]TLS78412.1 hypothetical protein FE236_01280 [Mariprofundus erugo]
MAESISLLSMGKIVVHIGLPKTATTTLQMDVFPALPEERITYLGVCQPRESAVSTELYYQFAQAVNSGLGIEEVRRSIGRALDSSRTLIISEEMFTVCTNVSTWRQKLGFLQQMIAGFDYELIVTVREPAAALFSYYCEMFPWFNHERQHSFVGLALNDERMEIFHYGKLTGYLLSLFDKERIHVIKFEDIIAGDLSALALALGFSLDADGISTQDRNSRNKASGLVELKHERTMQDVIREKVLSLGIPPWLVSRVKPMLSWPLSVISKIKVGKARIPKPSDSEMAMLRAELREENLTLYKNFGVKYES